MLSNDNSNPAISIKVLLEPVLAGSIIGKGGSAITELTEISGARIKISNINDCYPGTSDQVLLISGGEDEVDSAQELIWHRIAQHLVWKSRGSVGADIWDPRATLESIRRGEITGGSGVTGRLLIPIDACGAVIGANGSFIRSMSEETGVRIYISSKDDAISHITQERIVKLIGTVEDCIQCTANIIKKMQEESSTVYENKTTSYAFYHSSSNGGLSFDSSHRAGNSRGGHDGVSGPNGGAPPLFIPRLPSGLSLVSAVTTLTLSVTDAYAGQIIGKKGVVIADLQSKSHASISISARDPDNEMHEQGKRTVLIVGSPEDAQTALQLILTIIGAPGDQFGGIPELNIPLSRPNSKRISPPKGSMAKYSF